MCGSRAQTSTNVNTNLFFFLKQQESTVDTSTIFLSLYSCASPLLSNNENGMSMEIKLPVHLINCPV